jgi:type II secretory pathway predicted ATPase ExeA
LYHQHFGLDESPFGITPNPAFFYSGNTRGEILDALLYAVTHGEGIVKVSGEVGSGKTMLCRMMERRLPDNIDVIYLVNPSLGPEEVVYAIATELGLEAAGRRTDEVLRRLHDELIARHAAGRQVLLLVEEAQAMPLQTLEEIRLLTNLETSRDKLLQIVLFGQPELDDHLNLPNMRQLKERITHSFTVPPMEPALIGEFLAFRLRAAGYHGPVLFRADAVREIAAVSQGIVRRINILADKALLAAFADNADTVTGRHVKAAIREAAFTVKPLFARREKMVLGALLLAGALAATWVLAQRTAVLRTAPGVAAAPTGNASRQGAPAAAAPVQSPAAVSANPAALPAAAVAAATLVSANAEPSPAAVLRQCLDDTRRWLRTEPGDHLALQIALLPASDQARIEQFLDNTRRVIGMRDVHAYPLKRKGADYVAFMYGNFRTRDEALTVQASLLHGGVADPDIRDVATMRAQLLAASAAP